MDQFESSRECRTTTYSMILYEKDTLGGSVGQQVTPYGTALRTARIMKIPRIFLDLEDLFIVLYCSHVCTVRTVVKEVEKSWFRVVILRTYLDKDTTYVHT